MRLEFQGVAEMSNKNFEEYCLCFRLGVCVGGRPRKRNPELKYF